MCADTQLIIRSFPDRCVAATPLEWELTAFLPFLAHGYLRPKDRYTVRVPMFRRTEQGPGVCMCAGKGSVPLGFLNPDYYRWGLQRGS